MLLINSNNPNEVKKGYYGLENIALLDTLNKQAMYECGLTLSKNNKFLNDSTITIRQTYLNIQPNLHLANEWLYRVIQLDTFDYKSVYWAFNNLMEMKLNNTMSPKGDKQIVELYNIFNYRVDYFEDSIANVYKNAIMEDGKILKNWGLIK